MRPIFYLLLPICALFSNGATAADTVRHHISATLNPVKSELTLIDHITLPAGETAFEMVLSAAIKPDIQGAQLRPVGDDQTLGHTTYTLTAQANEIKLAYTARIESPYGYVNPEGVYLDRASAWYPIFTGYHQSFTLEVTIPATWRSISQGARVSHAAVDGSRVEVWREINPQDDIYLLAGPFHEYSRTVEGIEAMAFLRSADEALAERYIESTAAYLKLYNTLIGPYPYQKFALVENNYQTGFGMPSFTLLGSRVIRLPFIIYTSYPHELLHNWWGNSVYVDYQTGNWSEGLTSYLADHLLQEQRGKGADYRRDLLQKYSDFVSENRDFPLTEFRARHNTSSEAVGYGKAAMLFHMLRLELGDEKFIEGLRSFYRLHRYKTASFSDLADTFSDVADQDTSPLFKQWTTRTGAPALSISDVTTVREEDQWRLSGILNQTQTGAPYRINVPLAITTAGNDQAVETVVEVNQMRTPFAVTVKHEPLRIDVDPRFDIFRSVDKREIPVALSRGFGAESHTIILPSDAPAPVALAYRQLADAWSQYMFKKADIVLDSEIKRLPESGAVWILGWKNRWADQTVNAIEGQALQIKGDKASLAGVEYDASAHALVAVGTLAGSDRAVIWIGADQPAMIPGLARKLPHYRKYSYLAFSGGAPDNIAKGQWQVMDSPLTVQLRSSRPAALAPRAPLGPVVEQ